MMKFFRKYNKHLLAVFMALLLVIWLGGTALEELVKTDYGSDVVATARTGAITHNDQQLAEYESNLLARYLGISWQNEWGSRGATSEEQLGLVDWILLTREAKKLGVEVTPQEAKLILASGQQPVTETVIRTMLARAGEDIAIDRIYAAAAHYFCVQKMLALFQGSLAIPESELRLNARNAFERAQIEVINLPASVFADPEQTFSQEQLQAQFEKYKEEKAVPGTLSFGYYVQPAVEVEYIKVDPVKVKSSLVIAEDALKTRAYRYWSAHKEEPRFSRTEEEMKAAQAAAGDVSSNGKKEEESAKPVSPYYETFAEAQEKAIDAVKEQDARSEAERLVSRLSEILREPWYDLERPDNDFPPAPESVKNREYYQGVVAALPKNIPYLDAVEVTKLPLSSASELRDMEGIGDAAYQSSNERALSFVELAFNVEGLVEIPTDRRFDEKLYLSLWQTRGQRLEDANGNLYLFRVVAVSPGHVPVNLDEVVTRVADDLRLLAGMEKARATADAFVANLGTNGLKQAWESNTELSSLVSPDRGGFVSPPAFPRDSSMYFGRKNTIPLLGQVGDEFIQKAFELASKAEESSQVAVVEDPTLASVVVIKGIKLNPLYEESYASMRGRLQQQLTRRRAAELLSNWLNPKQIRERNQFKVAGR